MNSFLLLAILSVGLCGWVRTKSVDIDEKYLHATCMQLTSCNGVCSVEKPSDEDGDHDWEEETDPDQLCDLTRECLCWKPVDQCIADNSKDDRICHSKPPPSSSTFTATKRCNGGVAGVEKTPNCFAWDRIPCDIDGCDSQECREKYTACAEKDGVCGHHPPQQTGWVRNGICNKYNDCKCWTKQIEKKIFGGNEETTEHFDSATNFTTDDYATIDSTTGDATDLSTDADF